MEIAALFPAQCLPRFLKSTLRAMGLVMFRYVILFEDCLLEFTRFKIIWT